MKFFDLFRKAPSTPLPRSLPPVVIHQVSAFLHGSFVAPNQWTSVQCFTPDNSSLVARVSYGVSPLRDRIYVDGLEVFPAYRRQGYASSLLLALTQQCSDPGKLMPITALHELCSAQSFWHSLRNGKVPELTVTIDIRLGEMDTERQRWKGLSD